jgi:hypothetical protein
MNWKFSWDLLVGGISLKYFYIQGDLNCDVNFIFYSMFNCMTSLQIVNFLSAVHSHFWADILRSKFNLEAPAYSGFF